MKHAKLFLVAAVAAMALTGCTGREHQSAVDPAGDQAGHIHEVWSLYLSVTLTVYLIVMSVLAVALARRRARHESDQPIVSPPVAQEVRKGIFVTGGVILTAIILFIFLIADFVAGRRINALSEPGAPKVRVTGHQWWWEVRYEDTDPSKIVTTGNEIHIPVGQTIHFELLSSDVIHSFWVPNLHGKTDLIPGHVTNTFMRAEHVGTYWGQCAEFCGLQHANMRFLVVVESEEDYQKWLTAQRQPAHEPATETEKRGQKVFLKGTCVMCHTINGTPAQSNVGPELTHLASQLRIGAGTLPNTRGYLAGWVADPHGVKPGVRMPVNPLAPDELQSLLDYLESLK
jgi:cytochrome c oxidase subunit II